MINSTNEKPKPITTTTALPAGLEILKGVRCWLGLRYQYIDTGEEIKLKKTPQSRSGKTTGPNHPEDLGTYDEIAAMCQRRKSTGLAIHTGLKVKEGSEYVLQAQDLDHVRNPETGEITPQAAEIVAEINSYTEISASGTGLHIIYLALPDANMENISAAKNVLGSGTQLEIYTADHICGITGNIYGGYNTIGLRDQESKAVYLRYFEYAAIDQAQKEKEQRRSAGTTPAGREQIERLKGNIEDYLQRNGLPTKKRFRCLNPAHEDNDPSMSYYAKGKCCHCFGASCGVNYDIFDLAGVLENLPTFPEQLQYIASLYGEEVEPYRPEPEPKQDPAEEPRPIISVYEYLTGGQYAADLEQFQKGAEVKTGFPVLDQKIGGGLYAGLYVIGAASSAGKTTIALQIADQIAEQHKPVLFFSMEQSRLELVSKSISRLARDMFPSDQRNLKTSLQIRRGYTSEETQQAQQIYTDAIARYIHIIEGDFKTTADTIRATAERFINDTKQQPVIVIDYLQVVRPGEDDRRKDKRLQTGSAIFSIKTLSRDLKVPVILISSVNRDSYTRPLSMDSFKEAGEIEFTADVLIGLELERVRTFEKKDSEEMRRAALEEEEYKPMRKVLLTLLKNRYGSKRGDISYSYITAYDHFIENGVYKPVRRIER